ncbi:MAG TPA: GNAT family N-acetyltransferase [Kofleriaceae bacterium]
MPRDAYIALPDLEAIRRPDWTQIITPSFKNGGFNEISHAVLDATEADAVIDATIARYRDGGIKFRWTIGPDSAPADLGERLGRRGLVHAISHAMVRATDLEEDLSPDVTIERVDASNVDDYTAAMAEGWSSEPQPLADAHALILRSYPNHRMYLARVAGEPAATAGQVLFERSTYLLGAVVLPRFRRRGLYRALVAARLADARAAGLALATSHARASSSAPLLAKLGFATVCSLDVYSG